MRFSVKVPRVGLSGLNRAKPSHIRHSHIILRRISTSFVGSNRRRQQDSRKGCRLPASRRVFGVFGQSRGEPHNARLPPIFSLKTTDSKITGSQGRPCRDFRWDTILPGGLPGFYVRLPHVAPWRLQSGSVGAHLIKPHYITSIFDRYLLLTSTTATRGPLSMQTQPLPSRLHGLRGSVASPRKPRYALLCRERSP